MIIVHIHGDESMCDVEEAEVPGLALEKPFVRHRLNDGCMMFARTLEDLLANTKLTPLLREGLVDQGFMSDDDEAETDDEDD
jgi:hypothetical protein